jgi:hypothetical protein
MSGPITIKEIWTKIFSSFNKMLRADSDVVEEDISDNEGDRFSILT